MPHEKLARPGSAVIITETMLTTKTKVSLAALAYQAIAFGRGIIGKENTATVRRGGLRWCLDLSEGIDFSIYLLGAFERSTGITLQKLVKRGDVVFDIGANIGAHTLGLARSVGPTGHVFAFEPADFAFDKLKRNLALNPDLEARTHPCQILLTGEGCKPERQEIYASWPLKNDGSVHPKHRGRLVTTRNASLETLDDFVKRERIDQVDLMKMDVDGHELAVLQGGLGILRKFRPVLVMEMSPYVHAEQKNSFAAFMELLRGESYSLQDATKWRALPMDAGELEALIPDGASMNVIARPGTAF
jgi:FkbM family methyltransferase